MLCVCVRERDRASMVGKQAKGQSRLPRNVEEKEAKNGGSGYEKFREERIRENRERLEKMGILGLSQKLKSDFKPPPKRRNHSQIKHAVPPSSSSSPPRRRSSRLNAATPVNYKEKNIRTAEYVIVPAPKKERGVGLPKAKKGRKNRDDEEIDIKESLIPEVYTEEQEQLLGDCKTPWTLDVDGYDEDGQRIYDQFEGKHCHQCRLTTLGHHTKCSKCKGTEGQLCGDCLFTRYGENVIEANENLGWICPVCRGICNCSRCRRAKGWSPTGNIYWKVKELGFKSVAHYLIQTRSAQKIQEQPSTEYPNCAEELLPLADEESKLTDGESQPDHKDTTDTKENDEHGGSDDDYDASDDADSSEEESEDSN